MQTKKRITLLIILVGLPFLSGCFTSQQAYQGAAFGGVVGAAAGAIMDGNNPWRGAVIGGLLGAALVGTLAEISARAAREAAQSGKPVAYQRKNGWERVEAYPLAYNARTKCHKVRERVWKDGELIKDEITEICKEEQADSRS